MEPMRTIPVMRPDSEAGRKTVIPGPRPDPMFRGWGVRF